MAGIQDLVSDAELLVNYALQNKIALPSGSVSALIAARARLQDLESPGQERDRFYAALKNVVDVIPISASTISAAELRRARLVPLVQDAQSLVEYAAANAKKIDDDVRNTLVTVADSVARGTPALADEQSFFKAYEALTTTTAPVTAETLVASRTVLPDWGKLFSRAGFWASCRDLTLGRYFDAFIFIFVLFATCIALGYYSLGSTALGRYRDLNAAWATAHTELGKHQELLTLRQEAEARQKSKIPPSPPEALELARKNTLETQRQVTEDESTIQRIKEEGESLPDRLWKWSQLPCDSRLTAWALCSAVDKLPVGSKEPDFMMKVEAARTAVSRMSESVLPLLLGWLGAHAFVLRKMTSEISQRSFAKASSLRHIVRLSLGALAGFASTWLLTPEVVAGVQLKNIPAWALAFIAGYGIELVFSFMDRIIAAFTTRTS